LVKVIFPKVITKTTKEEKEVIISASSLNEAITLLIERYGEQFKERILDPSGKPNRFLNFYVNGKNVRFINDLNTPLSESDVLTILPGVGGG
jgi:MoaD family protein